MSDESSIDGASFQNPVWTTDVECMGTKYTVSVDESQQQRAAFLIKPKPVKNDANEDRVLSDHRESVQNVAMIIFNATLWVVDHHDEHHNEQTPDEHHMEPHHATFNAEAIPKGGLAFWYLIEIACDYLATVYGRAEAGRGFDILPPETHVDAWEGLKATLLSIIHWIGIGTVSPEPAPLPGVQSEWRDGT